MSEKQHEHNPLAQRTTSGKLAYTAAAEARAIPPGTVEHVVVIEPATHFDLRYQASTGDARVIRLLIGGLRDFDVSTPAEIEEFRVSVDPIGESTMCTFFTHPDSIATVAAAHILIEGGIAGDKIICRSHGSSAGLKVSLWIFRNGEGILREDIQDPDEHEFEIP